MRISNAEHLRQTHESIGLKGRDVPYQPPPPLPPLTHSDAGPTENTMKYQIRLKRERAHKNKKNSFRVITQPLELLDRNFRRKKIIK